MTNTGGEDNNETYTVWVKCGNCYAVTETTLLKGTLISDTNCPTCECFMMSRAEAPKKNKKEEKDLELDEEDNA